MRPLSTDREKHALRRTLDAETTGLGTPVRLKSSAARPPRAIVCVVSDGARRERFWGEHAIEHAVESLVALTEHGDVDCYAHFGGSFDFRLILRWYLRRYKVRFRIARAKSLPICVEGKPIGRGVLRLIDSYRLLPGRLAEIGRAVGFEKGEWSHDWHADREYAGGPPIPGKRHFRLHAPICYEALARYCERDCEVLDHGLDMISAFALSRGVRPRLTIASTAAASIRLRMTKETVAWAPPAIETVAVRACIGSRCEVYSDRCGEARDFDLQSSYPSAMLNPLPWRYDKTVPTWDGQLAALVECSVRVPDCYLPVLPYRSPLEASRIYFPTGEWKGVWTGYELAYAVRIGAVEILSVDAVHLFETSTVLAEFAREIWDLRRVAAGFEKYALKIWLDGGGYGKLVEGIEKDEIVVRPEQYICERHRTVPRRPDEHCQCMAPLAPSLGLYSYRYRRQPAFRAPWAGAAVLGLARVQLHERLLKPAVDAGLTIIYGDTDDCVCSGGELPTRKGELGQPALKRIISSGRFGAAKLYGCICEWCEEKDRDGNPRTHPHEVVRAKGFTGMRMADLLALLECPGCGATGYRSGTAFGCPRCQGGSLQQPGGGHEPFSFERAEGLSEALRRRKDVDYRRVMITRSLREVRPKRADGGSRPWTVAELKETWTSGRRLAA